MPAGTKEVEGGSSGVAIGGAPAEGSRGSEGSERDDVNGCVTSDPANADAACGGVRGGMGDGGFGGGGDGGIGSGGIGGSGGSGGGGSDGVESTRAKGSQNS